MINPMRTARTAVLALGLLGSAALAGMGPLSAHAGNAPIIQASAGTCSIDVTGSGFTPNGTVDLYVADSKGYFQEFQVTATPVRFVYPGRLIGGGNISQLVNLITSDTLGVIAYDVTTSQMTNVVHITESCVQ